MVLAVIFLVLIVLAIVLNVTQPYKSLHAQIDPQALSTNEVLPQDAKLFTQNGTVINVRLATTESERELGLSYFPTLPKNSGMLFLFDTPNIYPFWMKGMNFPLDIVWLKSLPESKYQVVYVASDVSPSTYPNTITPNAEADTVLEINANEAMVFGVTQGAVLALDKN